MRAWRNAFKIAWRESRASPGKFLFVVLATAIGVGALSGVRGFSSAFRKMLLSDARMLMAADLSVRMWHIPEADQMETLDRLVARGAERTWITETVSMMTSAAAPRPMLVAVKAVEPDKYPFYGTLELDPPLSLGGALDAETLVASDDLLLRLGVVTGERVRLGAAEFRIGARIVVEPDRMTGGFSVGPRVMLSREGLARAELIQRGSRASQRYLFRLPAEGLSIAEARKTLEESFSPRWIADFRETHPTIRRGLDRATNFLSLVSLIAMIVGAVGVAMAIHSHIEQRLDTIAIMKCVGARSGQIMRIFLIQAVGLGAAGSLAGVGIGFLVQAWAPNLIARYFPVAPRLEWQPEAALQAFTIGLLTTLLFAVPPLLNIRRVRPAVIFRREMERMQLSLVERMKRFRGSLWAAAAIIAGLGATATWLGDSIEMGLWFAGGLAVSLITLAAAASALLAALKRLPAALPVRLPTPLRHGLANLYRPGVHAEATLVALGVGVAFTLSVYLIQSSVIEQMIRSAPPDMPNVFLMNVTNRDRDGLVEMLANYPGVEGEVRLVPSVAARLLAVDGVALERMELGEAKRRFRSARTITWSGERPEEIEVVEGAWWAPDTDEHFVSAREDIAEILGLRPGSTLEWIVGAEKVEGTVKAIHRIEAIRPGSTAYFVLTPAALAGRPAVFYGGLRIAPERAAELQRDAFERFPSVTVINLADVLRIVQEVVDQIALVVRFVSAFAILAGIVILSSSVVATRFRRIRETAILKTLGATRRKVAEVFAVEFAVLGLAAGLIGALLASGFSALLLNRIFDAEASFDPWAVALTVAATAVTTNLAGWLAGFQILNKKPLEALRSE